MKCFVHVLVLLVINTGCPKIMLKMGSTALLIRVQTMLNCHINVCTGGDLCSPFFSNFLETLCIKVSFDVRMSFI